MPEQNNKPAPNPESPAPQMTAEEHDEFTAQKIALAATLFGDESPAQAAERRVRKKYPAATLVPCEGWYWVRLHGLPRTKTLSATPDMAWIVGLERVDSPPQSSSSSRLPEPEQPLPPDPAQLATLSRMVDELPLGESSPEPDWKNLYERERGLADDLANEILESSLGGLRLRLRDALARYNAARNEESR